MKTLDNQIKDLRKRIGRLNPLLVGRMQGMSYTQSSYAILLHSILDQLVKKKQNPYYGVNYK